MKTTIKKYKELPFEIDKVYQTKFATGEKVLLKRIDVNMGNIKFGVKGNIKFGVIYENAKHLGICPLGADRLIADKVEDGEMCVCDKCGNTL
jgi:hypothetical protein